MANNDPLLSFEEFYLNGVSRSNNFYMHFVGEVGSHMAGDLFRDTDAYKACMKAKPKELSAIAEKLKEIGHLAFHLPEYQQELYQAYVLMHPYAGSNYELFR